MLLFGNIFEIANIFNNSICFTVSIIVFACSNCEITAWQADSSKAPFPFSSFCVVAFGLHFLNDMSVTATVCPLEK